MKRKKRSKVFWFLPSLVLLFMLATSPAFAQKGSKASKAVAKQEKMKIQRKKEELKAYKKLLKHHLKIQSKDTRKRMRKNKRKATLINENKRPFFISRWFAHKQKKK